MLKWKKLLRLENIIMSAHRAASGAPPCVVNNKEGETESEAAMFNSLLCKLFGEWLDGNCSLGLYICRCTLCQGQRSCMGRNLPFHGSISETICETGQIRLDLTCLCDGDRPACRCHPSIRSPNWWDQWDKTRKVRSMERMLTKVPKASLWKATSPILKRLHLDQLLTSSSDTSSVFRLYSSFGYYSH